MAIRTMKRRTTVQIISFLSALFVLMAGLAIAGWNRSAYYQTGLEYSYQRALNDLGSYLGNITISLRKGLYVGTSEQFDSIATVLYKDSSGAKSCLSQLPVGELDLGNTQKFISQVGDFSISLSKKARGGEEITEEERQNFETLGEYADQLSEKVADMEEYVMGGKIQIGQVKEALLQTEEPSDEPSVNSGFLEMEEGFSEYPSLIYDGPFSDHIAQQQPRWLEGKTEIDAGEALSIAKQFTGDNALQQDGEEAGTMPSYCFSGDGITAAVTKAGGYISYFLNSRTIAQESISQEDAVEKARAFLEERGIAPMKESYYYNSTGVCTVNFAYMQGDVICYTDLIKVGVAMDTGEIVMFDARGYLMNHTERTLEEPQITQQQAQEVLSPALTVKNIRQALIPMSGGSEELCYEFTCTGKNDEEVLVYINMMDGSEEQILILLKSDGGILAM